MKSVLELSWAGCDPGFAGQSPYQRESDSASDVIPSESSSSSSSDAPNPKNIECPAAYTGEI